jgi:endonuclease-8
MRILVETDNAVAVGFSIPVAEFLSARELARHPALQALGPDLAADDFDREAAAARLRERGDAAIADALLDQRAISGVGNVFKSEVLFIARVNPFTPVRALGDEALLRVVHAARKQLRVNVAARSRTLAPTGGRRTTNSLHPSKRFWVYQRSGEPCRVCGARIQFRKTGTDARGTYWCPSCQEDKQARSIAPSE